MALITYDDKVFLNENPNIPAINKVSAGDMNQIKTGVNTNENNIGDLTDLTTTDKTSAVNAINELKNAEVYSTDEVKTNKVWIDGKPIYRKVISGNFNGVKETKAVNISENIDTFIGIEESAIKIEGTAYAPIPYTSASGYYKIGFSYITTGYIQIDASNNGTNPYDFRIVVLYTKTTD